MRVIVCGSRKLTDKNLEATPLTGEALIEARAYEARRQAMIARSER